MIYQKIVLPVLAIVVLSSSQPVRDHTAAFASNLHADNKNAPHDTAFVQFIFTSDAHYGSRRPKFRGQTSVDAGIVNAAMIAGMNALPDHILPGDGGNKGGKKIGYVDYIIQTGDISNRMEASASVQTAARSWDQFKKDYLGSFTLKNRTGSKAELLAVPGNHDVSNALGYYVEMSPAKDATTMANLYNLMIRPAVPATASTFNYTAERVNYSRDIGGVHFCFLQMWPDSAVRVWLNKDLKSVPSTTPVILAAHDPPAPVNTHFTNPNGNHSINAADKFINVLDEQFKDGKTISSAPVIEQWAFDAFLKQHPNIRAYIHGHIHESRLYTYTGIDKDIRLPAFSADSPVKGSVSAADETKVSFGFAVLNPETMTLTVRECFWNPVPSDPSSIKWGRSVTVSLN